MSARAQVGDGVLRAVDDSGEVSLRGVVLSRLLDFLVRLPATFRLGAFDILFAF